MGVVQRQYAIIEAPSILGLKPTGVERLAASFVGKGIVGAVKARHAGRVEPPDYSALAMTSGHVVGLEVTIYNPALDEDGSAGRKLTNLLVSVLGTSAPWGVAG